MRQLAPDVGDDAYLVLHELDTGDCVADERAQVDVPESVGEGAGLDPRGVEHVGDERRQPLGFAADQGQERLALVGSQLSPALAERLRGADHGGHRGTQLV